MKSIISPISVCLLACLILFSGCKKETYEELAPYRTYSALLNQQDTSAPTAVVLENTLALTISWTRTAAGKYVGTLNKAVNVNKCILFLSTPTTHTHLKGQLSSPTEISLEAEAGVNAYSDNFTNVSLELKEYK